LTPTAKPPVETLFDDDGGEATDEAVEALFAIDV
jgi:hypothetical protein